METLRDMERRKLVKEWASARHIDEYTFIITGTGLIQFRKQIQPVINAVAKQEDFEEMIEKTQGDSELKMEIKRLWAKIKDKTEDEIVQVIVKTGLKFGTKVGTAFLVHLFAGGVQINGS